jgi:hypothetical protein
MQHHQGDRVMYRDDAGNSQAGKIQRVAGSEQDTRYTILNDQTGQTDEVMHEQIERRLS